MRSHPGVAATGLHRARRPPASTSRVISTSPINDVRDVPGPRGRGRSRGPCTTLRLRRGPRHDQARRPLRRPAMSAGPRVGRRRRDRSVGRIMPRGAGGSRLRRERARAVRLGALGGARAPPASGRAAAARGHDRGLRPRAVSAGGGTVARVGAGVRVGGAIVVDNSSAWRMDPQVPLVVSEVNPDALEPDRARHRRQPETARR